MDIEGLTYITDYISPKTEEELLTKLKEQEWDTRLERRTLHYGYKYPYSAFGKLEKTDPIPDWLIPLQHRIEDTLDYNFDQAIVNEYTPGQGILPHIDHTEFFDDTIAVLSIGSQAMLTMTHRTRPKQEMIVAPRSLYVMRDIARYVYRHSIPKRKSDNGIKRGTRYSITFRKINE